MVRCTNCEAENPPDSKFCENCGVMLGLEESLSEPLSEISESIESPIIVPEKSPSKTIFRLIGTGLLVAFIGGLIWSLISIATGYEIGFMAIGLGTAAGIFVSRFRWWFRMSIIRAVAIGSSILGIFIGKFIAFYYFFIQGFREGLIEGGLTEAEASLISPSLGLVLETFFQNLSEIFGGFGVICVILALIAAWRLPRSVSKRK